MMLVTVDSLPGKALEILGMVQGSMIQSVHFGKKPLVGGELSSCTQMMDQSREIATQRMIQRAQALGADAIVAIRYSSSVVMQGAAEVLVYGTAVKIIP